VLAVTLGEAVKLTVGSLPVVLDTLKGATDGVVANAPQAFLSATAGQTKLTTI